MSKKRIILFDYGGTLTDIDERNPSNSSYSIYCTAAHLKNSNNNHNEDVDSKTATPLVDPKSSTKLKLPSPKILHHLKCLAEDKDTVIAIISGHTKEEMTKIFGEFKKFVLAAEKGAYFRWPQTENWQLNVNIDGEQLDEWQAIVVQVLNIYSDRTDGAYTQRKSTALVWHYHEADPQFGDMQAVELERYLARVIDPRYNVMIQRYDQSRILEVLPKQIHKGAAAMSIIDYVKENNNIKGSDIFIMSVGNDRSDEKMFDTVENIARELKTEHCFTVCIGIKTTRARFYLTEQEEMEWLLPFLDTTIMQAKKHEIQSKTPEPSSNMSEQNPSLPRMHTYGSASKTKCDNKKKCE